MSEETEPATSSETADETVVQVDEKKAGAENAKKLGNDAFAAKKFDEAIKHYDEAIKLDPDVAVYYSNRSACYAAKQNWKQALEDAIVCVSKDDKFIKGYFRLAIAQSELGNYDDAETTLRAALTKEPENDLIFKQIRSNREKKAKALGLPIKKPTKKLDEAQMKELVELQEQNNVYSRDLRGVQMKIGSTQRARRLNQVTREQIDVLPQEVPLYRSVGKAFLLAARGDVESHLDNDLENLTKNERDLVDRKDYLDRRIISTVQNMKDLTAGM